MNETAKPTDARLTRVLVMGPQCWGKDPDLKKARRIAKRHAPGYAREKGKWQELVYWVPEDAFVDEMGTIRWKNPEGEEPIKIEQIITRNTPADARHDGATEYTS